MMAVLRGIDRIIFLSCKYGALACFLGLFVLLGLAATFFALTRLRVEPQGWAIFPAGALALLAVVSATTAGGWLFPLVFIAAGVYLLWRSGALAGVAGPAAPKGDAPTAPTPHVAPPAPPAPPAAPAVDLPTERPAPKASETEARVDAETRLDDDGAPRT